MARSNSRLVIMAALAALGALLLLPGAAVADDCTPGVVTSVDDDAFEAWLEAVDNATTGFDQPAVTRHGTELDAQCTRWLLVGPPDAPRRTVELPASVPEGLDCVAPEDASLAVEIEDYGPTPSAAWLLAAGDPLVVLRLGLEPTFWSWDAERSCAVTWPMPTTAEPALDDTRSGDDDFEWTHTTVGRFPVTGGTLVLEASSHYESQDWTVEATRGCTMSGSSWSHDADLRWAFETSAGGAPIELSSTSDGDGMSDPDDDLECEPWTRERDGMVMVHHDGGRLELGVGDDELAAHLAACQASGSSRCSESRLKHERPAAERRVGNFFLDRHEVTRAQYAACVEAGACAAIDASTCQVFDGEGWDDGRELPEAYQRPQVPQLCVTRGEAAAYCAWADARLPTEAEWEAAAVGDTYRQHIFPWGDDWRAGAAVYLADEDAFGPAAVATHPDGDSPLGISDLAGNAYEWVDGDACALSDMPDGWEPFVCRLTAEDAPKGVVRGGSFLSDGGALRATARKFMAPDARLDTNGFRCAADGGDW